MSQAPTRRPLRLGLTGGIGSGKSTVASLLARHGASIIDADAIARSVTAPGGSAIEAIAKTFGPDFIGVDGALDRDRMRQLVFSEPDAKLRLEKIIHPLVGLEIERQARTAEAAQAALLVFDVPLLVESGRRWRSQVERVLVVDCDTETQIQRVMQRNAMPRESVLPIIASQASREARLAAADAVLFNDGIDMDQLASQVGQLCREFGL